MEKQKVGVLVMSYGTPESMDQIKEYYTHIRRGRPPAPEQLQDLTSRYEAIVGGIFPLRKNTNNQVAELEKMLNEQAAGEYEFVCYQGLKHASPYIEDGVKQMINDGIKRAVGIVLTPHYSTMSVGDYIRRAEEAAQDTDLHFSFVKNYHLHPDFIQAHVLRVRAKLQEFDGHDVRVIFTAHSLPEKILELNDPYPQQLLETSQEISRIVNIDQWQFAWQSAGQTAIPWLGPDILDVIRENHKEQKNDNILICPIGFVSDHLEILYDIDIECKELARELGIRLERTESLNIDPLYMKTLTDVVVRELEGDGNKWSEATQVQEVKN